MRLIDADLLKNNLQNIKAESNNKWYAKGLQDAIDYYFPKIIDDIPTVTGGFENGTNQQADYR